MEKNSNFNDLFKPVMVLVVICIAVSAILGYVNSVTTPVIEKNAKAAAQAAMLNLMPEAGSFEDLKYADDEVGVKNAYKADNGDGYIVTGFANGYGGAIEVMVAFDNDGKILGINITPTQETPGLGKKVEEQSFYSQFAGKKAPLVVKQDVVAITGATISSAAVTKAVNNAATGFAAVTGKGVAPKLTEEDYVKAAAGGETLTKQTGVNAEGITAVYTGENAVEVFVVKQAAYNMQEVVVYVVFKDGELVNVTADTSNQTEGLGASVGANTEFLAKLVAGKNRAGVADIDGVAGATITSNAVKQAVLVALDAYDSVKGVL